MNAYTRMSSNVALADDRIERLAPSVFATQPYHKVSDRYTFTPTIELVNNLRDSGFTVTRAMESRTRIADKRGFAKHMVVLRDNRVQGQEFVPEVLLVNSHDASTSYQLHAGLFRFICSNGLVVAESLVGSFRFRHTDGLASSVVGAAHSIMDRLPMLQDKVSEWKAKDMTDAMIREFQVRASKIRLGDTATVISPDALARRRRFNDTSNNLWGVYNRVQETLMRGGFSVRKTDGSISNTKRITAVAETLRINKELWSLTEEFAA